MLAAIVEEFWTKHLWSLGNRGLSRFNDPELISLSLLQVTLKVEWLASIPIINVSSQLECRARGP